MILLRKIEILMLHDRLIQEFGGSPGIRDEGALESALVAADNRLWYEQADEVACAATYAYHLTMAHAFIDGNKRVGAAAMRTFLIVNEIGIKASQDDLYDLFMAIASGDMNRDAIEGWLRARLETSPTV
jgi:death-on-curing protein